MTLKSVELIGFKSFGKKSLLTFSTPVTAIVGPNGSGKSNIVESIRFVLGEQSMKSLRGKSGADLIFKGSKVLTSSSRAMVTIVFDNSKKIFSFTNSGLGVSLDYDEIIISREVFADGANRYSINNTEVRLKDIIDLLASVNIGSSGYHIISQGEADRILSASNKDCKAMIEDALGLRIYQYRIKESERKLEKTILNMKEVQSLRREIAPQLKFLKKQVQVIKKAKDMREDLRNLYKAYLSTESTYVNKETIRIENLKKSLREEVLTFDKQIEKINNEKDSQEESEYLKEIKNNELKLSEFRHKKDDLVHSLGRVEGILESLKRQSEQSKKIDKKAISTSELKSIVDNVEQKINEALKMQEIPKIFEILKQIKEKINSLYSDNEANTPSADLNIENEYNQMKTEKDNIGSQIDKINKEENEILNIISNLREKEKEYQKSFRDSEHILYELLHKKNETTLNMNSLNFEEEKLISIKNSFERELLEAGNMIGHEAITYTRMMIEHQIDRKDQEDLHRKIERIKIKLEDIELNNGPEVMKEYQNTEEHDAFLVKELEDLKNSINSLQVLIQGLRETLDKEFKDGINKINIQFQKFFVLMFGGGQASLSLTMEYKKSKKSEEINDILTETTEKDEEKELDFERGIKINVSVPHKKVKDLNMLSGGERSLASIALLFSISQVNPPPFLVLDETDAALDEANSRKYGEMLENLSKYSQLVLVTHNRETMSRASVLYGITMNSEGVSKLLSIHLKDAASYAK